MANPKKTDVANLAECIMRLLELAINQADESKETAAVNIEDVYNELKPKLEELMRSPDHAHSHATQHPKQPR